MTTPTSRPTYWVSESQKPRLKPLATPTTVAARTTRSIRFGPMRRDYAGALPITRLKGRMQDAPGGRLLVLRRLVLGRLGRRLQHVLGGAVARVSSQHPPAKSDHANRGDEKRDAHEEPRVDPLAGQEHQACDRSGSGTIASSSSPDSRRSRSGMKLRTGGTFSKL